MSRHLSLISGVCLVAVVFAPTVTLAEPNEEQQSCADRRCHPRVFRGKVVHGPVEAARCASCHPAKGALPQGAHRKGAFRTLKDNKTCTSCHPKTLKGRVVHPPAHKQGCLHCHEAHSANTQGLIRARSERELCARCHKKAKFDFPFVHGPVAAGACSVCHASHAAAEKQLLIAKGSKLCFSCHDAKRFVFKFKHKALEKGCTGCHAPHGDKQKFFLRAATNELCGSCHKEILKVAKDSKHKHAALAKPQGCGGCHSPHGSAFPKLLKRNPLKTCTSCHSNKHQGKYQHGPVESGDCAACHTAHGSAQPHILKKEFPAEFYGPFSEKRYTLCFECHEADITKDRYTTTLTNFRDGKTNLHYLHVVAPGGNRQKGRSCKACHQVHAGPQPRHIREKVPFGRMKWQLPITFTKSAKGGSCVVGCHSPKSYRRK